MRKQTFGFVATLLLGANVLLPVFAQAESLNELDKKESAIARQSDKISGELQIALNDVNEKYQEVNDIRTKISENEAVLEKTKTDIVETEKKIEQRKEAIAERMKTAQVNGMTDRSINALLESKDLGEFLNRAFAMSVIQNAEKTKVASLGEAKDKLTELKATQEKTQAQLKQNSQSLEAETTKLDEKMANLKQELADNKTSLEKISQDKEVEKARQAAEKAQAEKAEKEEINEIHLRDKDSLYENDDDTSVVTMYLTVSKGNSSENTYHTWKEINSYSVYDYEDMGVERYQVAGLLQVGDENGPTQGEVGYGESVPNATVQIRGQTSSQNAQKNYKIELKKNKGTWRGQRTINLNKHMTEGMRFRNKLAYDLIRGIPQMVGLRTQFVHLYVKDNTEESGVKFEDYGIYTQVEQLNKTALKSHGLDSNGQLYKINSFEFYRYEDIIKKEDDAGYDKTAFEKMLEIKGDSDHTKLIDMLTDLNDYSIGIEDVLKEHFDEENIVYWMAFQILMGNVDTQNRNVYLYSPLNSDIWYFIAWDNDGCLMRPEYELRNFSDQNSWEKGISNYWGNILFQRCLKSRSFREKLNDAILDLREYLNKDMLTSKIESYKNVLKPYLYLMPDAEYEPLTSEQYDQIAASLPDEIEKNYQLYLESLETPMPFYIGVPTIDGDKLKFNWDVSYDLDAEDITYSVEVARDYLFQDVIYQNTTLTVPEAEMDLPNAGQYFVRVRATNTSGKTQDAFDYYVTDEGKHYGMKCFYITEDNTVEEDIYEEG